LSLYLVFFYVQLLEVTAAQCFSLTELAQPAQASIASYQTKLPYFFCRPTPLVLPAIRAFLYESNSRMVQVDSYVNRMINPVDAGDGLRPDFLLVLMRRDLTTGAGGRHHCHS
jgi:hypothetical protein